MTTFYIYALKDPRDSSVRYVGKTNNPEARLLCHANAKTEGTAERRQWSKDLRDAGLTPTLTILETVRNEHPDNAERRWMRHYLDAGCTLLQRTNDAYIPYTEKPSSNVQTIAAGDAGERELLTLRQVSKWLQVSELTVRGLVYDGKVQGLKMGRQWRFEATEIERYIDNLPRIFAKQRSA